MVIAKTIFWYKNQRLSLLNLDTLQWISTIPSRFFPIKLEETIRLWKNIERDIAFTYNVSLQLVSLRTTPNCAHI